MKEPQCSHIELKNAENYKKLPFFKKNWVIEANLGKLIELTVLKVCTKKNTVFISFDLLFLSCKCL